MCSGERPDSLIAALEAITERSVGLWPLREPPKVPNGVLLAATTKTPRERALLATISCRSESSNKSL